MATATDVISTARLRTAIGLGADEEDSVIEGFRDSAIDWVEGYTKRFIIDRPAWTTSPGDFFMSHRYEPDFVFFRINDVKAGDMTLGYVDYDDDPRGSTDKTETIATTDGRVFRDQDIVKIYSGSGTAWRDVMRFNDPTPTLTAACGMAAGDIPSSWGDAVALIVRSLYDGTAFDDLGSNSTLQILMRPWRCVVFGRSARR